MNHLEKCCNRELLDLQEVCELISTTLSAQTLGDICLIALVEINRELDTRKIQAEGRNKT